MSELKPISGKLVMELADVWENEGVDAAHPERRAAFREAADTLRTLAAMPRIDTTLASDRSPTHRCTYCGAFWMEWTDSWSLCSKECGPCCDNTPDFLRSLAPLIVSDIYTRTPPAADAEHVAWLYVCIKPVGDRQHLDPTITSAHRLNLDPAHWTETPLYTADQLQAYGDARAREALERAAGAYEAEADTWKAWPEAGAAKRKGAKAIRALKENPNG